MVEVGEFIRTEAGQILEVSEGIKNFIDEHESATEEDYVEFLGKVRHSFCMLNLLDVGDIVNGCTVFSVGAAGESRLCIWKQYNKTYTEITEDMIRYVITKEFVKKEAFWYE